MLLLLALLLAPLLSCGSDDGAEDVDEDGFTSGQDCNDRDPTEHPGADELCNHVDDDCDGLADNDPLDGRTFFIDADGDGWGDASATVLACAWSPGVSATPGDCDDTAADVHPGAIEDDCWDAIDYNCDGEVGYTDADADGYPACVDCDDTDPAASPDGDEICNARDDDCDGLIDEEGTPGSFPVWSDDDGDGYGDPADEREACFLPVSFVQNPDDCDDTRADVHPDAPEVCDSGLDEDCDGLLDTADPDATGGPANYPDTDGDGYGDSAGEPVASCVAVAGHVLDATDCDDADAAVHPGATEVCDDTRRDEDCDGLLDDADPSIDRSTLHTFHLDADDDGYGAAAPVYTCSQGPDVLTDGTDCDDADPAVHPGAADPAGDGLDADCDGTE